METGKTGITAVMAHGGARETYERHRQLWGPHIVVQPMDDKVIEIDPGNRMSLDLGYKSHNGPESITRMSHLLRFLEKTRRDFYVFHEYDSFCLDPDGVVNLDAKTDQLWCNLFRDDGPGCYRFSAQGPHHCCCPPWIIGRGALGRIIDIIETRNEIYGGGFWDRWLGILGDLGQVEWKDFGSLGYTKNTIEPPNFNEAKEAIKRGAIFIHGVKTKECYDLVTDTYNELRKL